MIQLATKYADVRAAPAPKPKAPELLIPKIGKQMGLPEWFWREMREGGMLLEYLRREKATSEARLRAVARRTHTQRPNAKSDWRLVANVPGREYARWKKEDPDFWMDDGNLRSLRRDNETMRHLIHV
jgi:hypothetical protein